MARKKATLMQIMTHCQGHSHSTFTGLTMSPRSRRELIESVGDVCLTGKINLVDRLYCPHMVEGHVYDSEGHKIPAIFLYDTGSLQVFVIVLCYPTGQ